MYDRIHGNRVGDRPVPGGLTGSYAYVLRVASDTTTTSTGEWRSYLFIVGLYNKAHTLQA